MKQPKFKLADKILINNQEAIIIDIIPTESTFDYLCKPINGSRLFDCGIEDCGCEEWFLEKDLVIQNN